jgi:hypothetical protein
MPQLHMRLLGEFHLTADDVPIRPVPAPRVQVLLAYLALHRDAAQTRQHLAFELWSDTSEAQDRTNLRQLLHALRQVLPAPDDLIHADAQNLQWRAEAPCRLDVAEFEQALAQADAPNGRGTRPRCAGRSSTPAPSTAATRCRAAMTTGSYRNGSACAKPLSGRWSACSGFWKKANRAPRWPTPSSWWLKTPCAKRPIAL